MLTLDKQQHFQPTILEEINGQYSLTFNTLVSNNYTKSDIFDVDGDYFQVAKVTASRDTSVSKTVYCEHVSYHLNEIPVGFEDIEGDAYSIMSALLQGTFFTVGSGIGGEYFYFKPSADNVRAALIELAKHVGGELVFHKYTVSMVYRRGEDKGLEFKLGLNLKGVTEEIDYTEIPYRKAYELDVLDLGHLEEYEELATAHIGDTVRIIDEQLGISDTLRIVSYEYNVYQKVLARVQIGNVLREIQDYKQDVDDLQKQILDLWALLGPFDIFKIGDIDMLMFGADETAQVKKLIKGEETFVEASKIYKTKKDLKGVILKLRDKFANNYITLLQYHTNGDGSKTFTKTNWAENINANEWIVPGDKKKSSFVFVVTEKPYNDLNAGNVDKEFIRAFGVSVELEVESSASEYMAEFRIENENILDIASDETEQAKKFFRGEIDTVIPSAKFYAATEEYTGLYASLKSEFSNYHLSVIVANNLGGDAGSWSDFQEKSAEVPLTPPNLNFIAFTFVISDIPFSELHGNNVDTAFIKAYGVKVSEGEDTPVEGLVKYAEVGLREEEKYGFKFVSLKFINNAGNFNENIYAYANGNYTFTFNSDSEKLYLVSDNIKYKANYRALVQVVDDVVTSVLSGPGPA